MGGAPAWVVTHATVSYFRTENMMYPACPLAVSELSCCCTNTMIYPACNKSRTQCVAYGNVVNFRGEPDLPGQDALMAPLLTMT